MTARAGRPDTYRAANNLLRMALDGKISLALRPIGFMHNKSMKKLKNVYYFVKYLITK